MSFPEITDGKQRFLLTKSTVFSRLNRQACRLCQFALPLVKREEKVSPGQNSRRNMQGVGRAGPDPLRMIRAQEFGSAKGISPRHRLMDKDPIFKVFLDLTKGCRATKRINFSAPDAKPQAVSDFQAVKRIEGENRRMPGQELPGFLSVRILDNQGHEERGTGVGCFLVQRAPFISS
jgi:hypothetical protein